MSESFNIRNNISNLNYQKRTFIPYNYFDYNYQKHNIRLDEDSPNQKLDRYITKSKNVLYELPTYNKNIDSNYCLLNNKITQNNNPSNVDKLKLGFDLLNHKINKLNNFLKEDIQSKERKNFSPINLRSELNNNINDTNININYTLTSPSKNYENIKIKNYYLSPKKDSTYYSNKYKSNYNNNYIDNNSKILNYNYLIGSENNFEKYIIGNHHKPQIYALSPYETHYFHNYQNSSVNSNKNINLNFDNNNNINLNEVKDNLPENTLSFRKRKNENNVYNNLGNLLNKRLNNIFESNYYNINENITKEKKMNESDFTNSENNYNDLNNKNYYNNNNLETYPKEYKNINEYTQNSNPIYNDKINEKNIIDYSNYRNIKPNVQIDEKYNRELINEYNINEIENEKKYKIQNLNNNNEIKNKNLNKIYNEEKGNFNLNDNEKNEYHNFQNKKIRGGRFQPKVKLPPKTNEEDFNDREIFEADDLISYNKNNNYNNNNIDNINDINNDRLNFGNEKLIKNQNMPFQYDYRDKKIKNEIDEEKLYNLEENNNNNYDENINSNNNNYEKYMNEENNYEENLNNNNNYDMNNENDNYEEYMNEQNNYIENLNSNNNRNYNYEDNTNNNYYKNPNNYNNDMYNNNNYNIPNNININKQNENNYENNIEIPFNNNLNERKIERTSNEDNKLSERINELNKNDNLNKNEKYSEIEQGNYERKLNEDNISNVLKDGEKKEIKEPSTLLIKDGDKEIIKKNNSFENNDNLIEEEVLNNNNNINFGNNDNINNNRIVSDLNKEFFNENNEEKKIKDDKNKKINEIKKEKKPESYIDKIHNFFNEILDEEERNKSENDIYIFEEKEEDNKTNENEEEENEKEDEKEELQKQNEDEDEEILNQIKKKILEDNNKNNNKNNEEEQISIFDLNGKKNKYPEKIDYMQNLKKPNKIKSIMLNSPHESLSLGIKDKIESYNKDDEKTIELNDKISYNTLSKIINESDINKNKEDSINVQGKKNEGLNIKNKIYKKKNKSVHLKKNHKLCYKFIANPQRFFTEDLCDNILKAYDLDINKKIKRINSASPSQKLIYNKKKIINKSNKNKIPLPNNNNKNDNFETFRK